jgi:DNA (cytosine-5)-methyltransferase 1
MNELALFAGAGGGLLATKHILGWRTVCYVENAPYPARVLQARIRDGLLDDAPIWDDARTFRRDNPECGAFIERLAELDDLALTAGFPCQPWATGGRGHGADDERNLWPETFRIVRETHPRWLFLENSPRLLQLSYKWNRPPFIERIVAELADLGYVGRWGCLSAADLGFEHKRQRLWLVAHASGEGRSELLRRDARHSATSMEKNRLVGTPATLDAVWARLSRLEKRLGEPAVFGTADGLAHRVDRLTAIGEGQVPAVAALAWQLLAQSAHSPDPRSGKQHTQNVLPMQRTQGFS